MLKNKSKLLVLIVAIITMFSTFSFAAQDEDNVPTDNAEPVTTNEEQQAGTENVTDPADVAEGAEGANTADIYQGDLYLFESDITMDKLVNGNVYLFGNNIKITGQIAGNLYVFGNNVTFEQCYIQASVYAFANTINFNAIANDLYAVCAKLEIPADCGVYRDLRVNSNDVTINGIVARDAFVNANAITLEKDGMVGSIYGNFHYNSPAEINIPEGAVQGETKYKQITMKEKSATDTVLEYVFNALSVILFAVVVLLVSIWLAPKAAQNLTTALTKKWLPSIGIGFASLFIVPIVAVILLATHIGMPLAIFLVGAYLLLVALSSAVISIAVGKLIAEKINKDKKWLAFVMTGVVALILWALKLIPFVGGIISFVTLILGLGMLLITIVFKNLLNTDKKAK